MNKNNIIYNFIVIGGGLGGITTCFILLRKYPDASILWVDKDKFNCGDLSKYSCVYANTRIGKMNIFFKLLVPYYQECITPCDKNENKEYCSLGEFAKELIHLTRILHNKSNIYYCSDKVLSIHNGETQIIIHTNNGEYMCEKVIMATGCEPKTLPIHKPIISLEKALNKCIMKDLNYQNKNIVVFGNRHSGILVLKNLYELGYTHITNIIRSDIKIPQYIKADDHELYDQIGIRGITLHWAQENLTPINNTNITIIKKDDDIDIYNTVIEDADYIIYAIGLKQRQDIIIHYKNKPINNQKCYNNIEYDAKTGLIDENIYGMGIGFLNYSVYKDIYECEAGMYEFYEQGMKIL